MPLQDAFGREILLGDLITYSVSGTVYVGIVTDVKPNRFIMDCVPSNLSPAYLSRKPGKELTRMGCRNSNLAIKVSADFLPAPVRRALNVLSRVLDSLKK